MKLAKNSIIAAAIFLCLVALVGWAWGEEYLSNLKNLFGSPPSPDIIGDIEVLDYWYGPFIVQFFTGSGLDERRYGHRLGTLIRVFGRTKRALQLPACLWSIVYLLTSLRHFNRLADGENHLARSHQ